MLLTVVALPAYAQRESSLTIGHLAGNCYIIMGTGGNVVVSAGADGFVMVDAKQAVVADQIRDGLRTVGYGEPAYIFNTHFHPDHTDGNSSFNTKSTIIAHTSVRDRLKAVGSRYVPDVTFETHMDLYFNDELIEAWHLPGAHTDGDIVVYFTDSNVAHLGDVYFNGSFPYMDMPAGGNVLALRDHVASLLKRLPKDVVIVPGHGPVARYDDLVAYHRMITETTRIVLEGKAAGLALNEIHAKGFPKEFLEYDSQQVPFEAWIGFILESAE